ncbi:hypothetical protein [Raineya sp.]
MFIFECELQIGKFTLDAFSSAKIISSRTLGDTAKIVLGDIGRKQKFRESVKVGDKVLLRMGYKGYPMRTEFEGYVSEISPNVPFEVECLDEIFMLRREELRSPKGKLGMSWKKTTLKEVLQYTTQGYTIEMKDIPDVVLSPFVIEPYANKAQVLKALKEEYGFDVYFRGNKLICGLGYTEIIKEEPIYHLQRNVIETDLVYRKKEDTKIKLKAISIQKDNSKVEVEVGDKEGEQRTWYAESPIVEKSKEKIKEKLKILALAQLQKYKYEGYSGKIKTFGVPYATHSMVAEIRDDMFPERKGKYFIEEVETEVSVSGGFKRTITFGKRAL